MASNKLTINRGTTYSITFNYQVDGVATSLVGSTVFFTVKSVAYDTDATDSSAVISKTITDGTSGGVATITLTATDTYLTPGTYFYDISVKDGSGNIYKMVEGRIIIDGSPRNRTT